MSGAQTSPFPNQNDLMTVATQNIANYYAPERNRLFIEGAKQEVAGREMEAMSRFASGLLDPAAYPTPEARAAAYGPGIQYLQSLGFAKNAPSTYPGDDVAKRLASMGIPAEKQWEQQGVRTAARNIAQSLTGDTPAAGSTPAVPGGAPGSTATPGVLPPEPDLAHIVAPGGAKLSVAAPYADRFQGLVNDLEAAGYKIDPGQTGGYNRRMIAGTNTPSEHASGAAVDINWINNARGTKGEIDPDLARKLAAKWGLTWGGDWSGDTRDPMHFEVAGANRFPVRPTAVASAAPAVPAVPAVPAAPPNRLLPPVGGGPAGGGMVGIDKPMSGGTPDVLGALEPEQAAPTQFAGPGVPLPPPPSTTGGFAGPGLEGGPAGNVLGGLTSVAPAAPAVPAAPAPVAPSVLPPLPPAPTPTNPRTGLTQDQARTFQGRLDTARTAAQLDQVQKDIQAAREHNDVVKKEYDAAVYARQEKAQADTRSAETQRLAQEAAKRAQDEADRKAKLAADPIQGTDDKANADRTLYRLVDKIDAGTATKEERRLYAQAAQYYLKPQVQWVDDPTDSSKKIPVPVDGKLPVGFPHPSYQPGDENKPPPPAPAVKTDFKPLPETERKVLIDTATKLDEINKQRGKFKDDYAGFISAAYGDAQNLMARNNPLASKEAKERANWWQDYQVLKLAVRQGISGQSLTASELAEFDKSDINPGMAPDLIKLNLERQDTILRTAHERRIGSLAADRYSPAAIEAASGLNPAQITGRPLIPSGGSPAQPAKPVGTVKVLIP